MDDAVAFAQRYVKAEHAWHQHAWRLDSDDDVHEHQKSFQAEWYANGVKLEHHVIGGDKELAEEQIQKLVERPIFRVEEYDDPTFGKLYTMETGQERQSTRRTTYHKRFFFAEVDGQLRIVSTETPCGTCYLAGDVDGRPCTDCGGSGAKHFLNGPKIVLGSRTDVRKLGEATSRRWQAANERP